MTNDKNIPDEIYMSKGSHVYNPNDVFSVNHDGALLAKDAWELTKYVRADLTPPQSPNRAVYLDDTDYSSPLRPKTLEYTMCGKIYAVQENGERHMFMDVRGWGYLTGGGAKKLPYEEATVIQDKWAMEVVNLWNIAATQADEVKVIPELETALMNAVKPSYDFHTTCPDCKKDFTANNGEWLIWCGDKEHAEAILAAAEEHLKRQKGR